jgi:hydrogenase expression/formation protein HypE
VEVVTGDTKVIERRNTAPAAGLFINTAGIGRLRAGVRLGLERIEAGDALLINGGIAEHGLAVMSVRSGIEFETTLRSDVAPLNGLITALLETGADIKFLRDATRGGVAGVLADIAEGRDLTVEIDEARVPLSPTARHAAELLGLDPLTVANEGKVVVVVAQGDASRVLEACRRHRYGQNASVVGRIVEAKPALVELITRAGGRRVVQRPYGEELPRIC